MTVEIFGTPNCTNCEKAVRISKEYGYDYEYKNITYKKYREELELYVGVAEYYNLPLVFINKKYVGHYSEWAQYIEDHMGGFGDQPI